jgi:hypothetical protein
MLDIGDVTKCAERPAAIGHEVPDAPRDEGSNQVVVERPSRLLAIRPGYRDQAYRFIKHHSGPGNRGSAPVARDHERDLWAIHEAPPSLGIVVAVDLPYLIDYALPIRDDFAPDSGERCASQIRSQRLTVAPTQILGVILWKDQHPSTKPMPGKHAQHPHVEVRAQGFSRQ